ncbi:hypothetical protein KEM52_002819, partial [Ascosphaera acerosa]
PRERERARERRCIHGAARSRCATCARVAVYDQPSLQPFACLDPDGRGGLLGVRDPGARARSPVAAWRSRRPIVARDVARAELARGLAQEGIPSSCLLSPSRGSAARSPPAAQDPPSESCAAPPVAPSCSSHSSRPASASASSDGSAPSAHDSRRAASPRPAFQPFPDLPPRPTAAGRWHLPNPFAGRMRKRKGPQARLPGRPASSDSISSEEGATAYRCPYAHATTTPSPLDRITLSWHALRSHASLHSLRSHASGHRLSLSQLKLPGPFSRSSTQAPRPASAVIYDMRGARDRADADADADTDVDAMAEARQREVSGGRGGRPNPDGGLGRRRARDRVNPHPLLKGLARLTGRNKRASARRQSAYWLENSRPPRSSLPTGFLESSSSSASASAPASASAFTQRSRRSGRGRSATPRPAHWY